MAGEVSVDNINIFKHIDWRLPNSDAFHEQKLRERSDLIILQSPYNQLLLRLLTNGEEICEGETKENEPLILQNYAESLSSILSCSFQKLTIDYSDNKNNIENSDYYITLQKLLLQLKNSNNIEQYNKIRAELLLHLFQVKKSTKDESILDLNQFEILINNNQIDKICAYRDFHLFSSVLGASLNPILLSDSYELDNLDSIFKRYPATAYLYGSMLEELSALNERRNEWRLLSIGAWKDIYKLMINKSLREIFSLIVNLLKQWYFNRAVPLNKYKIDLENAYKAIKKSLNNQKKSVSQQVKNTLYHKNKHKHIFIQMIISNQVAVSDDFEKMINNHPTLQSLRHLKYFISTEKKPIYYVERTDLINRLISNTRGGSTIALQDLKKLSAILDQLIFERDSKGNLKEKSKINISVSYVQNIKFETSPNKKNIKENNENEETTDEENYFNDDLLDNNDSINNVHENYQEIIEFKKIMERFINERIKFKLEFDHLNSIKDEKQYQDKTFNEYKGLLKNWLYNDHTKLLFYIYVRSNNSIKNEILRYIDEDFFKLEQEDGLLTLVQAHFTLNNCEINLNNVIECIKNKSVENKIETIASLLNNMSSIILLSKQSSIKIKPLIEEAMKGFGSSDNIIITNKKKEAFDYIIQHKELLIEINSEQELINKRYLDNNITDYFLINITNNNKIEESINNALKAYVEAFKLYLDDQYERRSLFDQFINVIINSYNKRSECLSHLAVSVDLDNYKTIKLKMDLFVEKIYFEPLLFFINYIVSSKKYSKDFTMKGLADVFYKLIKNNNEFIREKLINWFLEQLDNYQSENDMEGEQKEKLKNIITIIYEPLGLKNDCVKQWVMSNLSNNRLDEKNIDSFKSVLSIFTNENNYNIIEKPSYADNICIALNLVLAQEPFSADKFECFELGIKYINAISPNILENIEPYYTKWKTAQRNTMTDVCVLIISEFFKKIISNDKLMDYDYSNINWVIQHIKHYLYDFSLDTDEIEKHYNNLLLKFQEYSNENKYDDAVYVLKNIHFLAAVLSMTSKTFTNNLIERYHQYPHDIRIINSDNACQFKIDLKNEIDFEAILLRVLFHASAGQYRVTSKIDRYNQIFNKAIEKINNYNLKTVRYFSDEDGLLESITNSENTIPLPYISLINIRNILLDIRFLAINLKTLCNLNNLLDKIIGLLKSKKGSLLFPLMMIYYQMIQSMINELIDDKKNLPDYFDNKYICSYRNAYLIQLQCLFDMMIQFANSPEKLIILPKQLDDIKSSDFPTIEKMVSSKQMVNFSTFLRKTMIPVLLQSNERWFDCEMTKLIVSHYGDEHQKKLVKNKIKANKYYQLFLNKIQMYNELPRKEFDKFKNKNLYVFWSDIQKSELHKKLLPQSNDDYKELKKIMKDKNFSK